MRTTYHWKITFSTTLHFQSIAHPVVLFEILGLAVLEPVEMFNA
jgi:hypothetical protein